MPGSRRCATCASTACRSARRFTLRGDSLWWFAELYLHKEQAILQRVPRRSRRSTRWSSASARWRSRVVGRSHPGVVAAGGRARKIRYSGPGWPAVGGVGAGCGWTRAREALAAGARLSRLRATAAPARPRARGRGVRAHRLLAERDGADGSAESYIGPVLAALESRVAGGRHPLRRHRRAHQLPRRGAGGDPLRRARTTAAVVPIERYAPAAALGGSRAVWRDRHRARRSLWNSAELRAHAVIRGCDCWPLVREQLAGIALLQFPWSARSMDEAAAALDALEPDVAVTYAEAGGWGRALALECRRRGIPLAGLQHGFIYRHWLNYRHEPDETIAGSRESGRSRLPVSGRDAALRRATRPRISATRGPLSAGDARGHRQRAARRARGRGRAR